MKLHEQIKKILKEEGMKTLKFKFSEGGYLIPCKKYEDPDVTLTEHEFMKIKPLNDKLMEVYELEKHKLNLEVKRSRYYIMQSIDKLRTK
jgi:hypothetical protein